MVWRLNDEDGHLRQSFAHAIAHLRAPAGPQYQTVEECERDKPTFARAFHRGLFQFHLQTIEYILLVEERLKSLSGSLTSEQKISKTGWKHLRQIFRTFNDCIAWTIFKEPSFTIGRLCRHRSRGFLIDQNAFSIIKVITDLSKDGDVLAIWNDATRAIDHGDITAVSLENDKRRITFYEVKEGPINHEILEVLQNEGSIAIQKSMEEFLSRRGKVGLAQLERVIKQHVHSDKVDALVKNDDVEDPFTNIQRTAVSPHKPFEYYDDLELSKVLREVRDREFASISVDGCLHILAVNSNRREVGLSIDALIDRELKKEVIPPLDGQADCSEVIVNLQDTFYWPVSKPVMLRSLEVFDLADICIGNYLLFYLFDVNAWGRLFKKCRLSWSSVKEGGREQSKPFNQRSMVVDGRVPILASPSGDVELRLGDKILSHLISEGIRPVSMAEHYDVLLSSSPEVKKG